MAALQSAPKRINLAFQGGGSHGAFTWGVADRLLGEPRVEIEGICGASAGAMNASVLASGFAAGGRAGARAALAAFWRQIGEAGNRSPIQPSWLDQWLGTNRMDYSPTFLAFDMVSRLFSPYELNPANVNPLRDVVAANIDFGAVRGLSDLKVFVCATNVRTGKIKVFENKDLCIEAVLASACLPFMFQTVWYEGEPYWDGGYMGNPALYPLIYNCKSQDVVLVQINPLTREEVPRTARDILDRVNEISFNSSLMREMRAVHFVSSLVAAGRLPADEFRDMYVHIVEGGAPLNGLGASTKLNATTSFLTHLFEMGVAAADAWLEANYDALGQRSSVDVASIFL
ncbi:MAG: patatin-like phospholipase family protein [Alphaproteobacteria bacterium]|nr:patatin-like phospholipase family protein [Alphaproteobacteria bacterium]TAD89342.1 MAG: patatin-like phospholipase family protein [Alphaproteobacteria bacterium]